ncbi:MAG: endospore germination permease [Sporolactobacillus sp.]
MMNTNKQTISVVQLYLLLYIGIMVTGILTLPHPIYVIAQQNMWISLILGSCIGYPIILVAAFLNRHYPEMNLPQITIKIFGPLIGRLFIALFAIIFIIQLLYITKEYQIYLSLGFYQFTSPAVLILLLMAASLYACSHGIEVIARVSQIILPITAIFAIIVLTLSLPEMDWGAWLPVLEHGLLPPLKAAYIPCVWFSEFTWILFALNHISRDKSKELRTYGIRIVALTTLSLLLFFSVDLGILGPLNGILIYPTHIVERYVQIGSFIERISALFMSIWVLGMFAKTTFLFYILLQDLRSLFNLNGYRSLNFPIHAVMFSLCIVFFTSTQSILTNAFIIFIIVNPAGNILLPLIILIGVWIHVRKAHRNSIP